ncbi:MAG: hypothetical protein K8R19_09545, partial [Methanosarcinales archaeon]|nr:hypothetical protein [Methanosarcinales archaeon]
VSKLPDSTLDYVEREAKKSSGWEPRPIHLGINSEASHPNRLELRSRYNLFIFGVARAVNDHDFSS